MTPVQRAELTEFLRVNDKTLAGENELHAKVNKLAKYQRVELIRALGVLYGDVPESMRSQRVSLGFV
jgi:hypothetical protein